MREARIIIRALDVQTIAASAAAAGLYGTEPNEDGKLEPLELENERRQKVPCFELATHADRSGETLFYVTAREQAAMAWLQELATQDTRAQTDAQAQRRLKRLREEAAAAAAAAAAQLAPVTPPPPATQVSVTMTEPTPWAPAELDDDVDPPTPAETTRAKKRRRDK